MDDKVKTTDAEIVEHSDSHHNEHHHSRRRHHRSKRKNKINPKFASVLSLFLLVILVVSVVIVEYTDFRKPSYGDVQGEEISTDILTIEQINSECVLVKNAVNKYLLTDIMNSYNSDILPSSFSNGEGRLDSQVPIGLKIFIRDGMTAFIKIELANNDGFHNATVSYTEAANVIHEFKHLYANTRYYYRVTAYTSKGVGSKIGSFITADTPRILSIDGLYNVRDIGNWRTDSGKRIKQGLLIRGTEMDGAVEDEYHITNQGLNDMLDVFRIKTDMDLRAQKPTSMDALGSRVEHKYYDMVMYDGIFTNSGKDKIRTLFTELANPDNYPIYLHCTYGCDRTGTVCYLLEALLGVSRGDCLKDYGLSNLNIANIKAVENKLKTYDGNTLKEQTESYLLSCGVTKSNIESIRKIFLED